MPCGVTPREPGHSSVPSVVVIVLTACVPVLSSGAGSGSQLWVIPDRPATALRITRALRGGSAVLLTESIMTILLSDEEIDDERFQCSKGVAGRPVRNWDRRR